MMQCSMRHLRVPSVQFISYQEYLLHAEEARPQLDARCTYERSLATTANGVVRDGTCAPCLRRARFTASAAGGERLADGRTLPVWRGQLTCDCEDRLNCRDRALLHVLGAEAGLRRWSQVLLFGPPNAADRRIAAASARTVSVPRLATVPTGSGRARHRLEAGDAAFHLVVSTDYLHRVPPLQTALAELRRVLMPGGRLVFTVPFHDGCAATVERTQRMPRRAGLLPAEAACEMHALGWDLLGMLRRAGFAQARMHGIWADELGYLGGENMVFCAAA